MPRVRPLDSTCVRLRSLRRDDRSRFPTRDFGRIVRMGTPMKPAVAAVIVIFVVASAVRAADEAKFYPPQGWTVTKQPNGSVEVQPSDVPAGKTCGMILLPDVEGEVNVVHQMTWQQMTG